MTHQGLSWKLANIILHREKNHIIKFFSPFNIKCLFPVNYSIKHKHNTEKYRIQQPKYKTPSFYFSSKTQ